MKKNVLLILLVLIFAACTKEKTRNNKHDVIPDYKREVNIDEKKIESVQQIQECYNQNRPEIKSQDPSRVLKALAEIEKYVLNEDNLTNPEVHDQGTLRKDFRHLLDLYGYGISLLLSQSHKSKDFSKILDNYKTTIFSDCNIDHIDCKYAAAFKGSYGANILGYLVAKDIDRLKTKDKKDLKENEIKEVIFGLYVLKNFSERKTDLTGDTFIQFSSVFFSAVDIENITDPIFNKYLLDLQNIMVRKTGKDVSKESCSVFNVIDPLLLKERKSTLKSSFISQLLTHFYKCSTSNEIIGKIIKYEEVKKKYSQEFIEKNGKWFEVKYDIHSRKFVIEKYYKYLIETFKVDKEIPMHVLHLMDQLFYGKIRTNELDALLSRFSQGDMKLLIETAEPYAQLNFLYLMKHTYFTLNLGLEKNYRTHKSVNRDFVQGVYDHLWDGVGDNWIDFKISVSRLNKGISDVFQRLNQKNKSLLKDQYSLLKDKKLDPSNINELINSFVTDPIIIAMTYFSGKSGGGNMQLRSSYLSGLDNLTTVSTMKPLNSYFKTSNRNALQLLDYGYVGFEPTEFEKNVNLSIAVKTGFFDIINFDLGSENKGYAHNLKLFFEKYVEDNRDSLEITNRDVEKLRTLRESHWGRVKKFCENPISVVHKIKYSDLSGMIYLNAKESMRNLGKGDLEHISEFYKKHDRFKYIIREINGLKRTYQVLKTVLFEVGKDKPSLLKSFRAAMLPHYRSQKNILKASDEFLKDIQGQRSCLLTLMKMERFKKNILQRQTVMYLSEVYSAMQVLSSLKDNVDGLNASEIKDELSNILSSTNDIYKKRMLEKVINSSVLRVVENQILVKETVGGVDQRVATSGYDLLVKAMNLALSVHNMDADFGWPITDMSTRAVSLTEKFIGYRGGFDEETFKISDFDQRMRIREELYKLSAKAGDMRKYFRGDLEVISEIEGIDDEEDVLVNPGIEILSKNYKEFSDSISSSEKRYKITFRNGMSRETFVAYSLEKMFGNNQNGNHMFHWNATISRHNVLTSHFSHILNFYKEGLVNIPKDVENADLDVSCSMDVSFSTQRTVSGCESFSIPASEIVSKYMNLTQLFYLGEDELIPMTGSIDGLDVDNQLVENTLLNSDHIEYYKPGRILNYFQYYKYRERPEKWTWFDQFLADKFTTNEARDQKFHLLNLSVIYGVRNFERYYSDVKKSRYGQFLLPVSSGIQDVMRDYYRSSIMTGISNTEKIIEEVVKLEQTASLDLFPELRVKNRDVVDLQSVSTRGWVDIIIDQRSSGPRAGSLILLGDGDYEVGQYKSQQVIDFAKFDCVLLPRVGDSDFNASLYKWMIKDGIENCDVMTKNWIDFKTCEVEKKRAAHFSNYEPTCVDGLDN